MSYPTVPAFVHRGDFGDESRKHPAMKWMEDYTSNAVDARAFSLPVTAWHTPDFTLHKADGTTVSGGEPAWAAVAELYWPFTAHKHEPRHLVCYELPDNKGWEMIGEANVYANLPQGESGGLEGQKKGAKDATGKEWDVVSPGAFHFVYIKDNGGGTEKSGGIRLKRTQIFADSGPAMGVMIQRGLLKASDLGL